MSKGKEPTHIYSAGPLTSLIDVNVWKQYGEEGRHLKPLMIITQSMQSMQSRVIERGAVSSNQTEKDPQHAGGEFAPHRDTEEGGGNVKKTVMKSEVGTLSS